MSALNVSRIFLAGEVFVHKLVTAANEKQASVATLAHPSCPPPPVSWVYVWRRYGCIFLFFLILIFSVTEPRTYGAVFLVGIACMPATFCNRALWFPGLLF